MSKLHKSASGNWNMCTAFKKPCPLGGAHITEQTMHSVSATLANAGFDEEHINTLTAAEIETVAADAQMEATNPEYKAAPLEDMELRLPNVTGKGVNLNFGKHQRTLDRVERHEYDHNDRKEIEKITQEIQQSTQDSLKFLRAQSDDTLSKLKLNAIAMTKNITRADLVNYKMKPFTDKQIAEWSKAELRNQTKLRRQITANKVKNMSQGQRDFHEAMMTLKAAYRTLTSAIHVIQQVRAKPAKTKAIEDAETAARLAQQEASDKEREYDAERYSAQFSKHRFA